MGLGQDQRIVDIRRTLLRFSIGGSAGFPYFRQPVMQDPIKQFGCMRIDTESEASRIRGQGEGHRLALILSLHLKSRPVTDQASLLHCQ